MKKEKLIAVLSAAVVLGSVSAGMSAYADSSAVLLPAEDGISDEESVEYLDGSGDDEPVLVMRELYGSVSGDDGFLDICAGNKWGYVDMLKRSNPEKRQALYEELERCCRAIWNNGDELTLSVTSDGKTILFRIDNDDRGLTKNEVIESYYAFLYDNPVYYFLGSRIGVYEDADLQVYSSPDVLTSANRGEYQKLIKDYCESSAELVSRERTAYTNSLAIYDRVIADMDYAHGSDGVTPSDSFEAHSVIGGIADRKGVCESYAKILRLLYNYNGIENIFVSGKGRGDAHAWNMIRLDDGEYYPVDATWDDQLKSRDYFACGSAYFTSDHTADTPSKSGVEFLYETPSSPADGFSLLRYFDALAVDMDIDGDGSFTELDIRAHQYKLTDSVTYGEPEDIDLDGIKNNRDLKELQMLLKRYTDGK